MSNSPTNENDHYSSFQEDQPSVQEDHHKSSVEGLQVKRQNTSQEALSVNDKASNKDKSSQQDDIMEELARMEEQLKYCIRSQQFVEAEDLKNRVRELRLEVVLRRSREMDMRHTEEMDKLVEVQNSELQHFTETWDKKVLEYKHEAQMADQEMIKKHEMDLNALEQDLRASLPLFVRTSPKIANIRKMLETLAKQNEFVQAEKLKSQLAILEDEELRKGEEQKEKKLMFILMQLASKQKNELSGLQKRISTGFLELLKNKDLEYQKLLFKLHNIRKSLEATHQLELSKFELAFRNYIPGEKLQFKARKRVAAHPPSNIRKASRDSNALNTSLFENRNVSPAPTPDSRKRSVTPVRKNFHVRGYQGPSSNEKCNNLIPINRGRFVSNPKERNAHSFIKS